jgi:NADPH2:quinone reductase
MKAAVLHELGKPPSFEDFPDPVPGQDEFLVRMKAASISRVSKSRASGSHYDSYRKLPVVCGIDGVGLLEVGTRVFCGGARPPYGTMCERTVVPRDWSIPVPAAVDDLVAAVLPNAALSSWLPLVYRAKLRRGETVLVMGATGVAGKLAVQIAKHLGAGRVAAAGRNSQVLEDLPALGADAVISLAQPDDALADAFAAEASQHPFNVILDYVWGHPTEVLVGALTRHDLMAEEARTRLVSIGALAGPTAAISSAALRSAGLEIYGSGGGSVPRQAIAETFPKLWVLASSGGLRIDTDPIPLAEIEAAWTRPETDGRRHVVVI